MKKIVFSGFMLLILLHTTAQNSYDSDIAELKALNAKFINNFVTNDTASHNRIIHKNFVCITPTGG